MGEVVQLAELRERRGRQEMLATKREVAAHFRVSERTIERWMDRGLPFEKPFENGLVRFRLLACERWFRRRA